MTTPQQQPGLLGALAQTLREEWQHVRDAWDDGRNARLNNQHGDIKLGTDGETFHVVVRRGRHQLWADLTRDEARDLAQTMLRHAEEPQP